MAKKIHSVKMTRVKSCRYVPDEARTEAHTACSAMARYGVCKSKGRPRAALRTCDGSPKRLRYENLYAPWTTFLVPNPYFLFRYAHPDVFPQLLHL
jgi:hypothetical protein